MTASEAVRHPVRELTRVRDDVSDHRADSRVSAYVYGDVLVLAATAGVSEHAVRSGAAIVIVLGTVASTYLAHVLADVVGAVFGGHPWRAAVLAELRDSVPVFSAGLPSCVLFAAAALGWPSPTWAQALASVLLILRIAAIGLIYRRLRGPISIERAVWFGILAAVVGMIAAALKLLLTH